MSTREVVIITFRNEYSVSWQSWTRANFIFFHFWKTSFRVHCCPLYCFLHSYPVRFFYLVFSFVGYLVLIVSRANYYSKKWNQKLNFSRIKKVPSFWVAIFHLFANRNWECCHLYPRHWCGSGPGMAVSASLSFSGQNWSCPVAANSISN